MKEFKMGEGVLVRATMYPIYVDGKRKWFRDAIVEREAFYVGYAHKHEGELASDRPGNSYLKNIKTIKVLRIKFADWMNEKFALIQDVRRIS